MRSTLDPTNDFVFKRLFGAPENRDILVALLTAVLRPSSPIAVLVVRSAEVAAEDVDDKSIVLDLQAVLEDGRELDVEMQAEKRPARSERFLFYWARLYGSQLQRGQDYRALRPVISVLFLDYVEEGEHRFHSTFQLREIHDGRPFSEVLELHVIEIPRTTRPDRAARQEDPELLAWCRFFGAGSDEEVKEVCMSNPRIAEAQERLEALSADPEVRERAARRQLALDTWRIEMGGARAEGLAEGLRAAILSLASVLGLEVDEVRRASLERASAEELTAIVARLTHERRW